jgi:MoaA/NifB/PqqE/SkfB family radical SAM enzyme
MSGLGIASRALRHVPRLVSRRRPVHLTFFVTRRCNAGCPFCFYEGPRRSKDGPPELSPDEVARVARSLDGLLWVLFSGGEPYLREDLGELSQIFHDANRVPFLTIPTNGLLPDAVAERTEEILRRCPRSVVVVKLSLDGVGGEHDAIRRTPGGFDRVMRSYRALAVLARRFPRLEIGVNTLFCSGNQGRIEGIVEFVRGLEAVRSHTLSMVRGGSSDASCREVDLCRYRAAADYLAARWGSGPVRSHRFAGGRLKAAQDRLQRRLIHRTLSSRRRVIPCYAGRLSLVLTEGGELHPCEGRWDRSFGNVRQAGYDVAAMLRSARARDVREDLARGGCWCSHECNFLTNILFNPRMHPRLLREWARRAPGPAEGAGRAGENEAMAWMDDRESMEEVAQ